MGKEKRVENQQILGILRTKKHGVIFQVEICETDMDLTTKSWQQRVLNSQKDHQFLPWARNHPKNALRVFYFDLFCECWGVKIRLIPILDLFFSLSHKLTCFWLVSIKNVGWSSSHSWVKFPRTSAVSTRCQRLTAHFLTLYWDLRRNHFGLPKPFHVDLLGNRLPNKDIWDTTYYLTQLVQHHTLSASFHRRVCAHISTLFIVLFRCLTGE